MNYSTVKEDLEKYARKMTQKEFNEKMGIEEQVYHILGKSIFVRKIGQPSQLDDYAIIARIKNRAYGFVIDKYRIQLKVGEKTIEIRK
jgi:hypothetical protein